MTEQNTKFSLQPYTAVMLYETSADSADYMPLYEEEIALIEAVSEEDAKQKATEYAKAQECHYQNEKGETITSTFKVVVDIQPLHSAIGHGTTLYARHFRSYEAYANFEPMLSGEPL